MKRNFFLITLILFLSVSSPTTIYALGEPQKTVIYQVIHDTSAGKLTMYVAYSIVAHAKEGYWLQRTTAMQPGVEPLSITQTLLNDASHEPLRYIMHRPANMQHPENVLDLPLEKMGKDEILPTPLIGVPAESIQIDVPAGTFETKQVKSGDALLWLSADVPVLGVVKAETPEWTMELLRIEHAATDLLPKKPPKGGIVYLNE